MNLSILIPEKNGNQNSEQSYTKKYQKDITCCYDYKLECVDDKATKLFKTYLGKDSVQNFINNMIE